MFLPKKRIAKASLDFIQPSRLLRTRRLKKVLEDSKTKAPYIDAYIPQEENPTSRHPQDILHKKGVRKDPFLDPNVEVSDLKSPDARETKEKKLSAKQVAENLRSAKKSAKKNNLGHQNITGLSHVEVAKLLRQKVLYADENLVILNKPYGLSAHDGDKVHISLRSCLPILSKMVYGINTSVPLYLCNRLDKSTTGITVCVSNKDLLHDVIQLFRTQSIRKKYWAVTLSAPSASEGVIDIPLTTRHIEASFVAKSSTKMTLAPEQRLDWQTGDMVKVRPKNSQIALTYYRTLDRNTGLSFVELQPFTTVKHQMRVHLSEGISCPILGDHKYSKHDKLSPQTLPKKILSKFRIRQAESRNLPMHMHLRELLIPGILDKSEKPNLLISAQVPTHMYKTLKLFKMKPGAQSEFKYPSQVMKRERDKIGKSIDPKIEELYHDPFVDAKTEKENNEVQRDDCFAVYTPKVRVKFKYGS